MEKKPKTQVQQGSGKVKEGSSQHSRSEGGDAGLILSYRCSHRWEIREHFPLPSREVHLEAGLMPSVLDMSRGSLSFMPMIHFGASLAVPLGLCSISQENAISCRDTGSAQTLAEHEDKRDKVQNQSFKKLWEECTAVQKPNET